MAHTLYCDKKFRQIITLPTVRATLQNVVYGPIDMHDIHSAHGAGVGSCILYVRMYATLSPTACIGKIGQNFHIYSTMFPEYLVLL